MLIFRYIKWLFKSRRIRKNRDVKLARYTYVDSSSTFEGQNFINSNCQLKNISMGVGTYIAGNTKLIDVSIGKFCSIGQNVKNGFAQHPTNDFVSTHPAFFSVKKQAGFTFVKEQKFEEYVFADKEKKYRVIIGNDVWIGNNVILMDGITIGNGAIIATGAIVTKDIEHYTIVGGIPAKVIRKRFMEDQIQFLEETQWWNNSDEWLNTHSNLFTSIEAYINHEKSNIIGNS